MTPAQQALMRAQSAQKQGRLSAYQQNLLRKKGLLKEKKANVIVTDTEKIKQEQAIKAEQQERLQSISKTLAQKDLRELINERRAKVAKRFIRSHTKRTASNKERRMVQILAQKKMNKVRNKDYLKEMGFKEEINNNQTILKSPKKEYVKRKTEDKGKIESLSKEEYTPYEYIFDNQGNLIKEIKWDVGRDEVKQYKKWRSEKHSPYEKEVTYFENGEPIKKEIKETYRTYAKSKPKSSKTEYGRYVKDVIDYKKGIQSTRGSPRTEKNHWYDKKFINKETGDTIKRSELKNYDKKNIISVDRDISQSNLAQRLSKANSEGIKKYMIKNKSIVDIGRIESEINRFKETQNSLTSKSNSEIKNKDYLDYINQGIKIGITPDTLKKNIGIIRANKLGYTEEEYSKLKEISNKISSGEMKGKDAVELFKITNDSNFVIKAINLNKTNSNKGISKGDINEHSDYFIQSNYGVHSRRTPNNSILLDNNQSKAEIKEEKVSKEYQRFLNIYEGNKPFFERSSKAIKDTLDYYNISKESFDEWIETNRKYSQEGKGLMPYWNTAKILNSFIKKNIDIIASRIIPNSIKTFGVDKSKETRLNLYEDDVETLKTEQQIKFKEYENQYDKIYTEAISADNKHELGRLNEIENDLHSINDEILEKTLDFLDVEKSFARTKNEVKLLDNSIRSLKGLSEINDEVVNDMGYSKKDLEAYNRLPKVWKDVYPTFESYMKNKPVKIQDKLSNWLKDVTKDIKDNYMSTKEYKELQKLENANRGLLLVSGLWGMKRLRNLYSFASEPLNWNPYTAGAYFTGETILQGGENIKALIGQAISDPIGTSADLYLIKKFYDLPTHTKNIIARYKPLEIPEFKKIYDALPPQLKPEFKAQVEAWGKTRFIKKRDLKSQVKEFTHKYLQEFDKVEAKWADKNLATNKQVSYYKGSGGVWSWILESEKAKLVKKGMNPKDADIVIKDKFMPNIQKKIIKLDVKDINSLRKQLMKHNLDDFIIDSNIVDDWNPIKNDMTIAKKIAIEEGALLTGTNALNRYLNKKLKTTDADFKAPNPKRFIERVYKKLSELDDSYKMNRITGKSKTIGKEGQTFELYQIINKKKKEVVVEATNLEWNTPYKITDSGLRIQTLRQAYLDKLEALNNIYKKARWEKDFNKIKEMVKQGLDDPKEMYEVSLLKNKNDLGDWITKQLNEISKEQYFISKGGNTNIGKIGQREHFIQLLPDDKLSFTRKPVKTKNQVKIDEPVTATGRQIKAEWERGLGFDDVVNKDYNRALAELRTLREIYKNTKVEKLLFPDWAKRNLEIIDYGIEYRSSHKAPSKKPMTKAQAIKRIIDINILRKKINQFIQSKRAQSQVRNLDYDYSYPQFKKGNIKVYPYMNYKKDNLKPYNYYQKYDTYKPYNYPKYPEYPKYPQTKYPEYPKTKYPEYPKSKYPEYPQNKYPEYTETKYPAYPKVPKYPKQPKKKVRMIVEEDNKSKGYYPVIKEGSKELKLNKWFKTKDGAEAYLMNYIDKTPYTSGYIKEEEVTLNKISNSPKSKPTKKFTRSRGIVSEKEVYRTDMDLEFNRNKIFKNKITAKVTAKRRKPRRRFYNNKKQGSFNWMQYVNN